MQHCCHERKYIFGIKKCGKCDCSICRPPRLPDDVFKDLCHLPDPVPADEMHFIDLYGTLTSERHRPSCKSKPGRSSHGIPFSPNAQTARELILCSECLRPRVIYAQRKLSHYDECALSRSIEEILYTCGSSLQGLDVEARSGEPPSVLTLFDRVFVRANLTCEDLEQVEVPYYSSEKFAPVCSDCACDCAGADNIEGQYPLCQYCRAQGKQPMLKRKRKITAS